VAFIARVVVHRAVRADAAMTVRVGRYATGRPSGRGLEREEGDEMRAYIGLLLMVLAAGVTRAQPAPCTVAVNVLAPDRSSLPKYGMWSAASWRPVLFGDGDDWTAPWGCPVHDLAAGAFVARDKRDFIPIESVETDRGPRRFVFVVENGRLVTLAQRQVEAESVKAILSKARPEDSFGLLTAGGPRVALPLGSNRDTILVAAERWSQAKASSTRGEEVTDALVEATMWFEPHQSGDSIFLLDRIPNSAGNRREDSRLQTALASRQVRLFTLGLDIMIWGCGESDCVESPLIELSDRSGGDWEPMGPLPRKRQAKDASLRAARVDAERLYDVASQFYVLRLRRTSPETMVGLSLQELYRLPYATVTYPRPLPLCP